MIYRDFVLATDERHGEPSYYIAKHLHFGTTFTKLNPCLFCMEAELVFVL